MVRENKEVFHNLYQKGEVKELFEEAGFTNVHHQLDSDEGEDIHVILGYK